MVKVSLYKKFQNSINLKFSLFTYVHVVFGYLVELKRQLPIQTSQYHLQSEDSKLHVLEKMTTFKIEYKKEGNLLIWTNVNK